MSNKKLLSVLFISTMIYYVIIILILINTDFNTNNILVSANCIDNLSNNYDILIEIKTKKFCIFSPFIDLFDKSNSSYIYFPSYFISNNIRYEKENFDLLNYIIYNHFNILDHNICVATEYINNVNKILEENITKLNVILKVK